MTGDRITVVIITRNRRAELLHTLDRLAELPERPPVIVADNGSTDGTAEAVARLHGGVRLPRFSRNLGALGRNVAVREVRSPYTAFCDDDSWWEPGSLEIAVDRLDRHPLLATATARILVEPAGTEDPIVEELRSPPVPGPPWLPGRPSAPSSPPGPVCGPMPSVVSAVSRRGCGWTAKRSWSPPIWRCAAGGSPTFRR